MAESRMDTNSALPVISYPTARFPWKAPKPRRMTAWQAPVVARAFVAQEGVGAVQFLPLKRHPASSNRALMAFLPSRGTCGS